MPIPNANWRFVSQPTNLDEVNTTAQAGRAEYLCALVIRICGFVEF